MKKFKEKTDHLIEALEAQVKKLEKYVDPQEIKESTAEIDTKK